MHLNLFEPFITYSSGFVDLTQIFDNFTILRARKVKFQLYLNIKCININNDIIIPIFGIAVGILYLVLFVYIYSKWEWGHSSCSHFT